jgi:uncharacterized protein with ParB-like and HNH nuclease domain
MQAREIRFEKFLSQSKTNFIIPVYQRNYDWKEEQCKDFLNAIESLVKRERETHFLGTIVYIKSDDLETIESGLSEFIIIDGQQRITTTMLFLKAIYDLSDDSDDKEEILEEFLKIKRSNKLKLKPIKDDNIIFKKLLNNEEINEIETSKIYLNYKYFIDYFNKSDINVSKYYKTFRRLFIVYIELDRGKDDPQLIFESINSTGLSLSEADLIRNFILMDKKHAEQTFLFEEFWSRIEKNLLSENISSYIRDYLTMKESKIPNQKEVYNSFKQFVIKQKINSEELLQDLLQYSIIYNKLLFCIDTNKEIENLLKELKELKVTVTYPFLLKLFDDLNKGIITENILINCLELIKNYVFRRLICEYATNALNKIFMTLYKELTQMENYKEYYYESLSILLLEKRLSGTYPRNEEFKNYFVNKDMYKFKNSKYLLYKLESYQNKEVVPLSDLTIEHIMPQKLTTKWNIELGDKFNQIHEKYLHNIGNLTLSGYNSNLSNKSFQEKKELLKISGVMLNKYFDNISNWSKEEIEYRAENIFNKLALNIWKFPEVNESILNKNTRQEFYTLDDNFDVTGTKIKKIVILGESITLNSWIQCLIEFSNSLYKLDSKIFESFLVDEDFQGREKRIISTDVKLMRRPVQLKDNKNIYIECNLSANAILSYIKLIAEKYDLIGEDVIFFIN